MPSTSKSLQRLFSMALAVRKGELSRNKVWKSVLDIVDGDMTDQLIKDFTVLKESLYSFIKESIEHNETLKFYKNVVSKYNISIDTIKPIVSKFGGQVQELSGLITLTFPNIGSSNWNEYLDTVRDMSKELIKVGIPYDAIVKLGETGEHEEIDLVIRDEVK